MNQAAKLNQRRAMEEVVTSLESKSSKMRALNEEGYSRSEIAKFLDVRYQFVRNVLVREEEKKERDPISDQVSVPVGPGGRIVVPAPYRKAMGIVEGEQVMLRLVGDEVHIGSRAAEIRRAQDLVAKHVSADLSLVDELIEERRHEADRED
ncbi:MAG: AbrB/MazE/SpoVT family DNA-binding domain-containing protein [Rhodospirillaceae bacterium]|nr:AbrB/MazE/SpoVT family DNA-binding domain-containing protein [Rhodospirillaceae bacterium]